MWRQIMSKPMDIMQTASTFVAARDALSKAQETLKKQFPQLDEGALVKVAEALAGSAPVVVAAVPTKIVVEDPTGTSEPVSSSPKKRGAKLGGTRPRNLMVITTDGKEMTVTAALAKVLGKKQMTINEIVERFHALGMKTNSHNGDASLQHNLYVALQHKDTFTRIANEGSRAHSYQIVDAAAAKPAKAPKAKKAVKAAPAADAPVKRGPGRPRKADAVTVTIKPGRAPSAEQMLGKIQEKFGDKKEFFLRDVAAEFNVPAKTLSVNMTTLQKNGMIKATAMRKPEGAAVEAKVYKLVAHP